MRDDKGGGNAGAEKRTPAGDGLMFRRIRATVRRIPRGKVSTYGAVAMAAGYPLGSRQVAWALRGAAPDLPWHRVIGKGGKILLRGAYGVEQIQRLESEGVEVAGVRVALDRFEHRFRRRGHDRPDAAHT